MNLEMPESEALALKDKAIRGASVNMAAQSVAIACQTVGAVVLARLLGPADFGLVALVTAFSTWVANFGVNGFTEYIIYRPDLEQDEIVSIYWLHVVIASVLTTAFVGFGFVLVGIYRQPALKAIAAVMGTSFVFYALSTTPLALLKREMKFAKVALAELSGVVLSYILAIAAAVAGFRYWAVVIRQLTPAAVLVAAAWVLNPWRPKGKARLKRALASLKYAVKVYVNLALGFLSNGLDKVLLGRYHGASLVGNYDRAYSIFSMPAAQLLTPLHNVALASLSRLQNDKAKFSAYFSKAVSLMSFPGVLASVLLTVLAHDLVALLLGRNWVDAGFVVLALGPGIAAQLLYGSSSWLHLSLGTPDRWLRWNIVGGAVTVLLFVLAAPHGAIAMAAALSARSYLLVVPAIWYGGRPIRLRLVDILANVWPYFLSGGLVLASWFLLLKNWLSREAGLEGLPLIVRVLVSGGVVTVLYLALVVLSQRSFRSIRDVLALIPYVLRRRK
ncbi:MAG: lipopolysaccharide biosynthesis protein [Acidobacteria bacterium]|nr:lipopolysaccharide biosynthesis protein [Acidobacteriota bacterium]